MNRQSFQNGLRDGIPIGLGYLAVAFSFGMLASAGGLRVGQATLLSLLNLTSAGQAAGLNLMIAGSSYLEMALTQLTINLRYCLMSFSISQKLEREAAPWHRYLVAFGITDEIFGVTAAQKGKVSPWYSYGVMAVAIPGWTLGTTLGAISGNLLPAFITSALGIALYGMFVAVIIPPAKENRAVLAVVLAAMALSTLFQVVPVLKQVSTGFMIIIVTVATAGIGAAVCPVTDGKADGEKGEQNCES